MVRYKSHDQVFKNLIRTFPAEHLRLVAPAQCKRLALETVAFQPTEVFLDLPLGRERRFDLLARIDSRAGEPVLLHTEVEWTFRSEMAARLWTYHQAIQLRHSLPVHTVVLYLRGGPPGLRACIHRETWLGREVASLRYTAFGLSGARAEDFLRRRNPLAWGLAALMRFKGTPAEHQIACLTPIARARALSETQRYLLFNVVRTYLQLKGAAARQHETLLAERRHREVRNMVMTWADRVEAQGLERGLQAGRREGLQEGLQAGRQEGRQAGMRDLVLHLLSRRFSPLPAAASRKVAAIESLEELTSLADRILEAGSLDDLGLASS